MPASPFAGLQARKQPTKLLCVPEWGTSLSTLPATLTRWLRVTFVCYKCLISFISKTDQSPGQPVILPARCIFKASRWLRNLKEYRGRASCLSVRYWASWVQRCLRVMCAVSLDTGCDSPGQLPMPYPSPGSKHPGTLVCGTWTT